jgi:hypothetical protein
LEVHTFIVPAMASQSVYWIVRTLRGYHAYNSTFSETLGTLLTGNAMISLVIVFGLIIIRIIGRNGQAWRAGALFGFAGVANAAVALVQLKGWIYHTVPLILSAGFGAALFCAALLRPLSTRNRQIVYLAGILVLSSLLLFPYLAPMAETAQSGRLVRLPESEMTHLIREYTQPADRVMVLDTGVGGGYPDITYTGRRPAGRFLSAFPIAFVSIGSREYLPAPDLREDAERYNAMLKEDLAKDRPALIFISANAGATALPKGFRITEYLKSHGVYALLREDYDPMGVCGDFEVFRRRRSGTPGEQKQSRTD